MDASGVTLTAATRLLNSEFTPVILVNGAAILSGVDYRVVISAPDCIPLGKKRFYSWPFYGLVLVIWLVLCLVVTRGALTYRNGGPAYMFSLDPELVVYLA